jgi:hypothetical protein
VFPETVNEQPENPAVKKKSTVGSVKSNSAITSGAHGSQYARSRASPVGFFVVFENASEMVSPSWLKKLGGGC